VYRAVLFDVGGPIDMEFAHEIAIEGAIAAACGMEGIRVDQAAIDEASERAVEAFARDAHDHMIETLCGEQRTIERVRRRVHAMVVNLDVFQLRPGIDDVLRTLHKYDYRLGLLSRQDEPVHIPLARAGIAGLFEQIGSNPADVARALGLVPAQCIVVADRLDLDIAPAKALGMTTIRFRTGRYRRQQPRSPAEIPDADVTDVRELEEALIGYRTAG
jgi:FMN phosphatase YigB (HAD superfamily)